MPIDDYVIERMNHIADADERMAKHWRRPLPNTEATSEVNDEEANRDNVMPNVLPQRGDGDIREFIDIPDNPAHINANDNAAIRNDVEIPAETNGVSTDRDVAVSEPQVQESTVVESSAPMRRSARIKAKSKINYGMVKGDIALNITIREAIKKYDRKAEESANWK